MLPWLSSWCLDVFFANISWPHWTGCPAYGLSSCPWRAGLFANSWASYCWASSEALQIQDWSTSPFELCLYIPCFCRSEAQLRKLWDCLVSNLFPNGTAGQQDGEVFLKHLSYHQASSCHKKGLWGYCPIENAGLITVVDVLSEYPS